MHLHPDPVLPVVQLECARAARYPKMPMTGAETARELALTSNDESTTAARLQDLPGGELEIKFEQARPSS